MKKILIKVILCLTLLFTIVPMHNIHAIELVGSTHAQKVFNYFVSKGYSKYASAAIVGNIMWESGSHGDMDFPLHVSEVGGSGIGMCQWSGVRKTEFINYCASLGISWKESTLEHQVAYLEKELNTRGYWVFPTRVYSSALYKYNISHNEFKSLTDLDLATGAFCFCFERPSEVYARLNYRIDYAKQVLDLYGTSIDGKPFPFSDVSFDTWYRQYVQDAYDLGLMTGATDTLFKPHSSMNRAMVAVVFYRMEGSKKTSYKPLFSDVKNNEYYSQAITWAKENGVINGYTNGTFKPLRNVSREEMATMIYNFARYKGLNVSSSKDISGYKDYAKITPYAISPLKWTIEKGIISGKDNGTRLDPLKTASRAECAKMLVEAHKIIYTVSIK